MEGGFLIPTYVKESTIKSAGKGRFIIGNHKKGSIIIKQEINSETLHVIKNKDELKNYNIELLKHFAHTEPKDCNLKTNYVYLNFPPMNTNHSENNNIDYIYFDKYKITYLIRNVKDNEELLQNYCNFKQNNWFEDYLHNNKLISARELGINIELNNPIVK